MQASRRYSFWKTLLWQRGHLALFIVLDSVPVVLYLLLGLEWIVIPWQPISLIGLAVAFYLGFKNNSSYERLWEARKAWGEISSQSRVLSLMARDFITNQFRSEPLADEALAAERSRFLRRHLAWVGTLVVALRKPRAWEHDARRDRRFRDSMAVGGEPTDAMMERYLTGADRDATAGRTDITLQLAGLQSDHLERLRAGDLIEDFRHMEMMRVLGTLLAAQGACRRIKDFPFPRQYSSANFYFVWIFLALLPFSMIDVFAEGGGTTFIWLAIPFSVTISMIFLTMEVIGDYSENPFEGLYNDVPIEAIARQIEIDVLELMGEEDVPSPLAPRGDHDILL